jgi:hypothetical protein
VKGNQQGSRPSETGFFEGIVPVLLVIFVNCAILLSTLLIIFIFTNDASIPLKLANTPKNFPVGSITAVFSPDTQVFLDFASWKSWYLQNLANFTIPPLLFLGLNWNINKRERGIRFVFYSLVFLILPILANVLNLVLIDQSTLGPSGAFYASIGLLVGFGIINLWAGDTVGGGLSSMIEKDKIVDAILFVLNGIVGAGLLLLSFVNQAGFFSEAIAGYTVGYGIHIFCFYSAVALSLLIGYLRRSSIAPKYPSNGAVKFGS